MQRKRERITRGYRLRKVKKGTREEIEKNLGGGVQEAWDEMQEKEEGRT